MAKKKSLVGGSPTPELSFFPKIYLKKVALAYPTEPKTDPFGCGFQETVHSCSQSFNIKVMIWGKLVCLHVYMEKKILPSL